MILKWDKHWIVLIIWNSFHRLLKISKNNLIISLKEKIAQNQDIPLEHYLVINLLIKGLAQEVTILLPIKTEGNITKTQSHSKASTRNYTINLIFYKAKYHKWEWIYRKGNNKRKNIFKNKWNKENNYLKEIRIKKTNKKSKKL